VCSAVQNQDFTLIDDYVTRIENLAALADWTGQSPPNAGAPSARTVAAGHRRNPCPPLGPNKQRREALEQRAASKRRDLLKPDPGFNRFGPVEQRPVVKPVRKSIQTYVGASVGLAIEFDAGDRICATRVTDDCTRLHSVRLVCPHHRPASPWCPASASTCQNGAYRSVLRGSRSKAAVIMPAQDSPA
uniref:Transposase n=1 Tax=Macrostomum lignano TaxID=282301 RepID=A0A1I8F9H5_9PLAT